MMPRATPLVLQPAGLNQPFLFEATQGMSGKHAIAGIIMPSAEQSSPEGERSFLREMRVLAYPASEKNWAIASCAAHLGGLYDGEYYRLRSRR